ncbi:MAG: hypothetical protein PHO27_10665 [Sulfuricurvum sp.]|nr:hypothetical protein [Sulfuricurvum sp.]
MTNIVLISILLYLIWVLLYLQHQRIKKLFYPKVKLPPNITPIFADDDDIMGKTKTQLSHVVTNDDSLRQIEKPIDNATTFAESNGNTRSPVVENSELDSVFSDSPESMDLDIESEYNEDDLLEEEDLNCFVEDEITGPATGIQYDEMENLVQVMKQSGSSQEAELIAMKTFQQMEQTELFHLMVSQISGGKERVTEMLNKYNINSNETNAMNPESHDGDFQQFEINNFI